MAGGVGALGFAVGEAGGKAACVGEEEVATGAVKELHANATTTKRLAMYHMRL